MGVRLGEVLDEIAEDAGVRVAVLTGAGDRAFCAGGDLKERRGMTPEQWTRQHRIFERAHHRLRNLRKPIFAAVNGVAVGGGCEMAMSTDFLIASELARLGQPEVTRGIMPGAGGTQLLPRFLPRGLAFQLLMTGELISAEEAHRWGLVNRVCPPAELMDEAMRLAEADRGQLAFGGAAGQAVRPGWAWSCRWRPASRPRSSATSAWSTTPDRHEGVDAFNERRSPVFRDA